MYYFSDKIIILQHQTDFQVYEKTTTPNIINNKPHL